MLRRAPGRPRAALAWTGAALAGSWLVPLGTHAVGADLVLPPLAWLVTASLLRSGRTVLDRLVLAGGLLLSGTVVAGLLFSVWPWGLHPVAIAGCGFTLLTVAAWLTRRGPSLPRRAGDPAVLAGTGLAALAAWWPMRGRDAAGRLSLFMHIEDFSRHLNMYDTIRLAHGYMFLNQPVALRYTVGVSFLTYPQGAHLAYAVLENFAESSTVPGSAPVWADHFVWWHLAGFVGLCAAVLWGVRRVAGPGARLWGPVLVAVMAGYLLAGDPLTVYSGGYPQEVVALAALALLVAVLLRPLHRWGEQLLLSGLLLATVSFTYYFFLPPATLAAAAWLVLHRRRWRSMLPVGLPVAAGAAVLAALPPVLNSRIAVPSATVLLGGQATAPVLPVVTVLVAAAAVGPLLLARRRSPLGVQALAWLAATAGYALAVGGYARLNHGQPYFTYKAVHELVVVAPVCLGAAAYPLSRLPARRRLVALAAALALAVGLAAAGGVRPGWRYLTGRTSERLAAGRDTLAVYRLVPTADGRATVVLLDGCWPDFLATLYVGVLRHDFALTFPASVPMRPWQVHDQLPGVLDYARTTGRPLRVVVRAGDTGRLADLQAAGLPSGQLEIVTVPTGPTTSDSDLPCT